MGHGVRQRAGGGVHDHEAVVAARHEPDTFGRPRRRAAAPRLADLPAHRRRVTDRGDASGTGYWSPARRRTGSTCSRIVDADRDWTPRFPEVLGPRRAWRRDATRPPTSSGCARAIVGPGTGDNMAAALGIGLRPGDVAISLGTSGTVFTVSDTPTADPTGAVAGFADATGRFLPLVCTLNATLVTDAFAGCSASTPSSSTTSRSAAAVRRRRRGASRTSTGNGPRTDPTPPARCRHPRRRRPASSWPAPRSKAWCAACSTASTPCDDCDADDRHDRRLFLVGGGARSAAYRQIVADLADREVTVPADDEHVADGRLRPGCERVARCGPDLT